MTGVVLDTNVISEPVRPDPSEAVLGWIARQDPETLFLTATVVGEIAFGIEGAWDAPPQPGTVPRMAFRIPRTT